MQCVICFGQCENGHCSRCAQLTRGEKFTRFLHVLERCSESIMYHDEIASVVQRIRRVSSF